MDGAQELPWFSVDGARVPFRPGDTFAIAMVREGIHPGSGGVLCLAGDCPNCLCSIDGDAYRRSCRVVASAGATVRRHSAGDHDVPVPDPAAPANGGCRHARCDVVVIGNGDAGSAAADDARRAGRSVIVIDEGRGMAAIGLYPGPQVVYAADDGIVVVRSDEVVVATGSAEEHPVCPGADLPGVVTGRAAGRLADAGVDLGRVEIVGETDVVVAIEGDDRVRTLVLEGDGGRHRRIECDSVVVRSRRHPRDAIARMLPGDPAVRLAGSAAVPSDLPPPPVRGIVCPCAGVAVDDLADAWERGFSEVELLKRATLAGTGPCQGAVCLPHVRSFVAARVDPQGDAGRSADGSAPFTARPVARQITMANAAAGAWLEPVKRTALDAEHRALGARMERTGGWWRPWTYGDRDRGYAAVRGSVGICDVSTLGTFIVGGPDAVAFLERIYPIRVADLVVGRMRYSLLLDERGVVFDDGLVCREADGRFWLTVTTAGATFFEMWLRDWAEAWSMDVRIMDRTDALAAINVTGPRARSLLTALGVDPEALPGPMRFADLEVGGVSCRAMRSAFTGEVSFELVHATDESVRLWRALTAPDVDPVAVPHGIEALLRLRLEKGHVIVGLDTELDSTPRRLGLSALVDDGKSWFVGKEAMARSDALPLDRQLVGLELDGDAPADGEVLFVDGVLVGHVTSATRSPALGRSVALAWLTPVDGTMPETVECGGRRARRVATPFYDSEGARARA